VETPIDLLSLEWHGRPAAPLVAKLVLVAAAAACAQRAERGSDWRASAQLAAALLALNTYFDAAQVGVDWNAAPHGRGSVAPLFAYYAPRFAWPAALHALLALAALAVAPRASDLARWSSIAYALGLAGFAFASAPLLALSSPPDEVFAQFFRSGLDYPRDVARAADPLALLRGYVAAMPELGIHARTHGPGALLLLAAIGRVVGPGEWAQALALQALGALLPAAAWLAARRLVGERPARIAGLLVALSPSFQLFSFVSLEAVFALPLVAALACGTAALFEDDARSARRSAWLSGAASYAAAFFSFSISVVAIVLACAAARGLYTRALSKERAFGALVRALAAGLSFYVAVRALTGFDLAACLAEALRQNAQLIASSWSSPELHTYAALGNLAAFAYGCGIPTAAVALRGLALRRGASGVLAQLGAALAAALAIVVVAGFYVWEVERIWLFLVPSVAAMASSLIAPLSAAEQRRVLGVVWLQSFATEIALQTWW
jgi:hypothetical protein